MEWQGESYFPLESTLISGMLSTIFFRRLPLHYCSLIMLIYNYNNAIFLLTALLIITSVPDAALSSSCFVELSTKVL